MRLRSLALVATLALPIAAPVTSVVAGDVPIPVTMAMPDGNAFMVAVIPDLLATLGRIEQYAEMFVPGQVKPGMLKMQLGAALGDPELANFAGKPVLIAVGPGAPTPSFAVVVPAKNAQAYLDAAANLGMPLGKAVEGLAVLAQTPDGETLGEALAANYAKLTGGLPKADARLLLAPDKVMTTYAGMLGMFAQMAAGQAAQQGNAAAGKILQLELVALQLIAADISAVQLDLTLGAGGVIGEEIVLKAKPGTALAKSLVAAPVPAGQRAAARMGAEPSLMAMSGRLNWAAQSEYLGGLLAALKAKPEAKNLISDQAIALTKQWGDAVTGDFAFRMRPGGADAPFLWEGLYGSADQAKADAIIDGMGKLFTGDGALAAMYRDMGVTMAMTKGARTAPSGASVYKMSSTLDETKIPAAQVTQMKAMMKDYELAVTKGWMVMAQDPKSLDALIAGTGQGMALKAEKSIGAGRQTYVDMDFIGFVKAVMKFAGNGMEAMIPAGKASEPLAIAGTIDGGAALIEIRWPLQPLADIVKSFGGGAQQQPKPEQAPAF